MRSSKFFFYVEMWEIYRCDVVYSKLFCGVVEINDEVRVMDSFRKE